VLKGLARAIYALPLFAAHDPRRRVVKITDSCRQVAAFPIEENQDAQDWYLRVRRPEILFRTPPIGLNHEDLVKFDAGARRYQSGNRCEIPEVFLACIHGARIESRDFLVRSAANRILFESALSDREVLERNGILDTPLRRPARSMPGSYCLLASPWSPAYYYHWLLDALPRLAVIEQFEALQSLPLIVPESLTGFQRDSLALGGIPPQRLAGFDGRCARVDRLYFPQLLGPTGNPSPHAVSWLRSRFQAQMVAEPATLRRLYVSRSDAPKRRVLNEDRIIDFLRAHGFEIICPGRLSLAEQIALFSQAGVVVGPHGAGLTNIVFAPAGATLIEFFGDSYINGCFWALANLRGQTHAFLTSPTETLDFEVRLDDLKSLLRRVCGI
jgi:hypothetical protein